jgi:hypothetical protein
VAACLRESDAVERGVELAVPGAGQAMARSVGRPDRQRCAAVVTGEGVLGSEPVDAGGLADDSRRGQARATGNGQQRRRDPLDSFVDLTGQFVDLDGQSSAVLDQSGRQAGDKPSNWAKWTVTRS